jgi:excisionase family DNA binding protein
MAQPTARLTTESGGLSPLRTRREAAALTGLSVRTIRDAIKAGLLHEVHCGIGTGRPTYRIPEAELVRFISERNAAFEGRAS